MNIEKVIQSQYFAALEMLRNAVVKCPDKLWEEYNPKSSFWNIVYHVLYYVHKNLLTEDDFVPWSLHRKDHQLLKKSSISPHLEAYSKDELLAYLEFCESKIIRHLPETNWDADSGFPWLPFTKLELHIHSIRHIQHHTAQLIERLDIDEVNWVSTHE